MNNTEINYKDVKVYCEDLHIAANEIKKVVDELEPKIFKVYEEMWGGSAASVFIHDSYEAIWFLHSTYLEMENAIMYIVKCSDAYEALDKAMLQEIQRNLEFDGDIREYPFTESMFNN